MIHVILDAKTAKRLLDLNTPLVAFDTETTGLVSATDYVIEIGAVRFGKDGMIGEPFSAMIKPPVPIPEVITQITGITDSDVQNAKSAAEVLPLFLEYIGDAVLAAHNAGFDLGFLSSELQRAKLPPLEGKVCDTLTMYRRLWPGLPKGSYKLDSLANRCAIDKGKSHRATDDARTCAMLLLNAAKLA